MILITTLLSITAWAQDLPDQAQETTSEQEATLEADDTTPNGANEEAQYELPPILIFPELATFVEAPYPTEALDQGIEGSVGLILEINEVGEVTYVEVVSPLGYGFDEAATTAAWELTFTPAEDENGPTPVAIEFSYGFVLDSEATDGAHAQEIEEEVIPAPINLDGRAIEMVSRRPLEEMAVSLPELSLSTLSDAEGRFEFRGVPNGEHTLQIGRPGWETATATVEIVEGEITTANLWVKNANYGNDEAVGVYQREREEITRRTITVDEIRRIPGTLGDPIRVIQNLPGAARAPLATGLLVIRGSNPEDSAIYVDGIRIPFIYHLGGIVSVINADIIESVDYLPGGYGVRYGRSTGGVIDVSIKDESPEQGRMVWSTDVLDTGALFEGRVGENDDHHVAVAARRSYIDAILPSILGDTDFIARPVWMDYQLRWAHHQPRTSYSALLMGFTDSLLIGTPDDVAQGTGRDSQGDLAQAFYTHRGILEVEREISDQLSATAIGAFGVDGATFNFGSAFNLERVQYLYEFRGEIDWEQSEHFSLKTGIDAIFGHGSFKIGLPLTPSQTGEDSSPLDEREPFELEDNVEGYGPDLFLQTQIRPLSDPDALLLSPGLRYSYSIVPDQYSSWSLDPRIGFRARLAESTFIKGGAGIYTQPPQPFESYSPSGAMELFFEKASSSSLGIEMELTQGLSIDAEGFYKNMWDLITFNPEGGLSGEQPYLNSGLGRAYGLEFMLKKAPVGNFFGWISYTISKSERIDYPDYDEDLSLIVTDENGWYPYDFDQTHNLVVLGGYQWPWGIYTSAKFQYTSGNPYTPYDLGVYDIDGNYYSGYQTGIRNGDRMAPYSALDIRIEKRFQFPWAQLSTYLDVLNIYKGENPEFINYNYDYTEHEYITGLPLIPSIGFDLEVRL